MEELTVKQGSVLNFIIEFIDTYKYSPSAKDVKEHFKFKSINAAQDHLNALKRKGRINTTPNVARSIVVLTENNGWISIKDKMPDDEAHYYDAVLVYCEYNACKECDVAYLNDDGVFISEESDIELPVTHWQSLPQPPSI